MFHLCTIQEISSILDHEFKDRPEFAQSIQDKTLELLDSLHKHFESEDKPQDILLTYSNGGFWVYKNVFIQGVWNCEDSIWMYKVEFFQSDCQSSEGHYESYHWTVSSTIHKVDWITDKKVWTLSASS